MDESPAEQQIAERLCDLNKDELAMSGVKSPPDDCHACL
jgi:hypothetical protein